MLKKDNIVPSLDILLTEQSASAKEKPKKNRLSYWKNSIYGQSYSSMKQYFLAKKQTNSNQLFTV